MSEMVERVARAICAANGDDADKEYPVTLPGTVMSFGQWQKQWELVSPLARAAIAAMREPTGVPMLLAGKQSLFCCAEDPTIEAAQACWQAMIDAALGGEG